jgi:hypothetical protein
MCLFLCLFMPLIDICPSLVLSYYRCRISRHGPFDRAERPRGLEAELALGPGAESSLVVAEVRARPRPAVVKCARVRWRLRFRESRTQEHVLRLACLKHVGMSCFLQVNIGNMLRPPNGIKLQSCAEQILGGFRWFHRFLFSPLGLFLPVCRAPTSVAEYAWTRPCTYSTYDMHLCLSAH